mmetsp:Transcript_32733/g.71862  ORF Transcript_32733/g.71862 Transcript_32733/m.71862 type:complete len:575 (+) Transcript_32733:2657-4381(+)
MPARGGRHGPQELHQAAAGQGRQHQRDGPVGQHADARRDRQPPLRRGAAASVQGRPADAQLGGGGGQRAGQQRREWQPRPHDAPRRLRLRRQRRRLRQAHLAAPRRRPGQPRDHQDAHRQEGGRRLCRQVGQQADPARRSGLGSRDCARAAAARRVALDGAGARGARAGAARARRPLRARARARRRRARAERGRRRRAQLRAPGCVGGQPGRDQGAGRAAMRAERAGLGGRDATLRVGGPRPPGRRAAARREPRAAECRACADAAVGARARRRGRGGGAPSRRRRRRRRHGRRGQDVPAHCGGCGQHAAGAGRARVRPALRRGAWQLRQQARRQRRDGARAGCTLRSRRELQAVVAARRQAAAGRWRDTRAARLSRAERRRRVATSDGLDGRRRRRRRRRGPHLPHDGERDWRRQCGARAARRQRRRQRRRPARRLCTRGGRPCGSRTRGQTAARGGRRDPDGRARARQRAVRLRAPRLPPAERAAAQLRRRRQRRRLRPAHRAARGCRRGQRADGVTPAVARRRLLPQRRCRRHGAGQCSSRRLPRRVQALLAAGQHSRPDSLTGYTRWSSAG